MKGNYIKKIYIYIVLKKNPLNSNNYMKDLDNAVICGHLLTASFT